MSDEELTVIQDIPFGSALAYTKGQKISKEAVEANGWQDYVAGSSTKAAKAATAETGEKES